MYESIFGASDGACKENGSTTQCIETRWRSCSNYCWEINLLKEPPSAVLHLSSMAFGWL